MAAWFIENENSRRDWLQSAHAEISGAIYLDAPLGPIKLTARADRLNRDHNGNWTIIDYKTGTVPSKVRTQGVRNQLAVEGLIACEGGFDMLPAGSVNALEYWQLSGKRVAPGEIKTPFDGEFILFLRQRFEEWLGALIRLRLPIRVSLIPVLCLHLSL